MSEPMSAAQVEAGATAKRKAAAKPKGTPKKKRDWRKWTPERAAKFKATMAAKRAAGWQKQQPAKLKTKKHNGAAIEFPLDAIPERAARKAPAVRIKSGNNIIDPRVFAEYDLKSDTMMLVLGSLRLPLRVKP
jgi:hypothetical protein